MEASCRSPLPHRRLRSRPMACLGQLWQRKLLLLPKSTLTLVTENRDMSVKSFFPVLLWFHRIIES